MDLELERLVISSSSSSSTAEDLRESLKKLREMRQKLGHEVHPISHMMMMMPRCPFPSRNVSPTLNINPIQKGANKGFLEVAGPSKERTPTPTPYPQTHPLDEYLDSPESPSIISLQRDSPNPETKSPKTGPITPPLQKKVDRNFIQNPMIGKNSEPLRPSDLMASAPTIRTGEFQNLKTVQTPQRSQNIRDATMPAIIPTIAPTITSTQNIPTAVAKQGLPSKIKPMKLGFATKTIRPVPSVQVTVSLPTIPSSHPGVSTTTRTLIPDASTQNVVSMKRPIPSTILPSPSQMNGIL